MPIAGNNVFLPERKPTTYGGTNSGSGWNTGAAPVQFGQTTLMGGPQGGFGQAYRPQRTYRNPRNDPANWMRGNQAAQSPPGGFGRQMGGQSFSPFGGAPGGMQYGGGVTLTPAQGQVESSENERLMPAEASNMQSLSMGGSPGFSTGNSGMGQIGGSLGGSLGGFGQTGGPISSPGFNPWTGNLMSPVGGASGFGQRTFPMAQLQARPYQQGNWGYQSQGMPGGGFPMNRPGGSVVMGQRPGTIY